MAEQELIFVYITCKDEDQATKLAELALEAKLIACANVLPKIKSIYTWQGKIESEAETLLVCKTLKAKFSELEKLIQAHHNYDCPCITAFKADAVSQGFIEYITNSVS